MNCNSTPLTGSLSSSPPSALQPDQTYQKMILIMLFLYLYLIASQLLQDKVNIGPLINYPLPALLTSSSSPTEQDPALEPCEVLEVACFLCSGSLFPFPVPG